MPTLSRLLVLAGAALLVLAVLYGLYTGVNLRSLNPHDHVIQNGLTYWALLLFTYLNYTVFVLRWYLARRYGRYIGMMALSLFLAAGYRNGATGHGQTEHDLRRCVAWPQ